MFNFDFGMLDDYEERMVGRFEKAGLLVSTARVSDGQQPYETAVGHPEYNEGKLVIVEAYPDRATALFGHGKWVKMMTDSRRLRISFKSVSNCSSFESPFAEEAFFSLNANSPSFFTVFSALSRASKVKFN